MFEEEGDQILLLKLADKSDESPTVKLDVMVTKNRFGGTGDARFQFYREFGLVQDIPFDE